MSIHRSLQFLLIYLVVLALPVSATAQELPNNYVSGITAQDILNTDEYPNDTQMFVPAAEPVIDDTFPTEHDDNTQMFVPAAEPVTEDTTFEIYEPTPESPDILDILTPEQAAESLPNPTYELEYIRIVGNYQNSKNKILSIMELEEGSKLTLEQLEDARVRLMISGLFNAVDLHIYPGSERKKLELELIVDERSPFQVNRYFIGTSQKSPFWMGLDVSWLAPFASSHRFRMAFTATSTNDYSLRLSYMVPSIRHQPISLMFSIQSMKGHEGIYSLEQPGNPPVTPPVLAPRFHHWDDMDYEKHGAMVGLGYSLMPELRFVIYLEYMNLLRQNDIQDLGIHLNSYLHSGQSHLTTIAASVSYDTRKGRIMPNSGHMLSFGLKGTAKTAASQYSYIKAHLAHQSNWSVAPQHVLRLNTFGGFVYGTAPFFEKFFFHDFYSLGTSRTLGLNPSNRGAYDLFNTGTSGLGYEDFLVHLAFSYAWQPRERQIELFITGSATWADSLHRYPYLIGVIPKSKRDVFPIDLSINAGAHFKTDYGIFSLTISHILDLVAR